MGIVGIYDVALFSREGGAEMDYCDSGVGGRLMGTCVVIVQIYS